MGIKFNGEIDSQGIAEHDKESRVSSKKTSAEKQSLRYGSKRNTLTPRQQEVIRLLAKGMKNREIATALKLNVKTIDAHRASIMTRLQIFDVAGLVKYATQNGLSSLEE